MVLGELCGLGRVSELSDLEGVGVSEELSKLSELECVACAECVAGAQPISY